MNTTKHSLKLGLATAAAALVTLIPGARAVDLTGFNTDLGFANDLAGGFNTDFGGAFNSQNGSNNIGGEGGAYNMINGLNSFTGPNPAFFNYVGGLNVAVPGGNFNFLWGRDTNNGGFNGNCVFTDSDPAGVRQAVNFSVPESDSMTCLFANGTRIAGLGNSNSIPGNHVLHVQSTQQSNSSVLACQVGDSFPNDADNQITFFNASGGTMGAVECVNATTVAYTTTGSDFAEVLAMAANAEPREATEIVPVHAGEIGDWNHADHYMVISDQAGFVGNAPGGGFESDGLHHRVAFLGQVPVQVLGAVNAGDYILASELNDGTGIAKSADEVSIDEMARVVGRAWESSSEERLKEVNTAVGLDQTSLVVPALERLENENAELRRRLEKLEKLLEKSAE